jgi:hypothetical protein
VVCLRFDLVQRFASAFDPGDDVFGGGFPDEWCGVVVPVFGPGGDGLSVNPNKRQGRIVNASLAEYHVPVHLDIPTIDVIFLDIPDEHTPFGAHGIGEIGITGVAAAIANAVFNATGKRIRDLPTFALELEWSPKNASPYELASL